VVKTSVSYQLCEIVCGEIGQPVDRFGTINTCLYIDTKRKDMKVLLRSNEIIAVRVAAAVNKKQTC
jgi:hypothetical protein